MNLPDELKTTNRFAAQSRSERHSEFFKLAKMFTQFNVRDIIDDIQQGNAGTGIVCSLIPPELVNVIGTAYNATI